MDAKALQSLVSFTRRAYDHAERCAERADEAEMSAMIACAYMREACKRMRATRQRDYDFSDVLPSHAMTSAGSVTPPAA